MAVAFFSLLACGGVVLVLLNPDGSFTRPFLAAAMVGGAFGFFAILGVLLLVSHHRVRLYTSNAAIRYTGLLGTRTLPLDEIIRAVWRNYQRGGSLTLHTPETGFTICFGQFEDARELVQFCRATLPQEVQERYEKFEAANVPDSIAFRHRQNREQSRLIAALPVAVLAFGALLLWDPRAGVGRAFGGPLVLLIFLGVSALYWRLRAGRTAANVNDV
jgi:hypothetical protein